MATISITKEKYSVDSLYQWDTNQILEINGIYTSVVPEVHFANASSAVAIVQTAMVNSTGTILAEIPDILLEKPNKINVYVCTEVGDKFQTLKKFEIPVKSRPKPADYVPDEKEYVYALRDADVEVVDLAPDEDATVEKVYDGEKVTLRFGIPIVNHDDVVRDVVGSLPVAGAETVGGVKADPVTDTDTTPVRIDSDGYLWTGAGNSMAVRLIPSIKIRVGADILPGANVTLGAGWSGNLSAGFTHAAGSVEPLVFDIGAADGDAYYIQGNCPNTGKTLIEISVGDSYPSDPYDGTTTIAWGVRAIGSGPLIITPKSDFVGTLTNLSCKKNTEGGTEEITVTLDDIGHNPSVNHISGMWNTQIGKKALENLVNGTRNIALGYASLNALITGGRNIGIGTFALAAAKNAENNINIGADSGLLAAEAVDNVGIGKASMGSQKGAINSNVAIGPYALYGEGTTHTTECNGNIAIGDQAGYKNGKKSNVFIGKAAGYENNDNINTFVGNNAGQKSTGWGNTAIGAGADISGGGSQSLAIGNGAKATKSHQAVIGGDNITETCLKGNLVVRGTDGVLRQIVFNADGSCSWKQV